MASSARVLILALCGVACASTPPRAPDKIDKSARPLDGAVLLAVPGAATPFVEAGTTTEIVRGRVRWHLDADGGATRLHEVVSEPIQHAVAMPAWLGGGAAYVLDAGLAVGSASGAFRPVFRGSISSLSIGAHELWARERPSGDYLRIDPSGKVRREAPPIAAPILAPWSSSGGRGPTSGPEFLGPKTAIAIVDLLGPVLSRDGGDSWTPLDRAIVRAAFPDGGPKRILRDGASVSLAGDDRAAVVSSAGTLGAPQPIPKAPLVPDVASIRVESLAPFGVPLAGDLVLVADAGRFATLQREPTRVLRVSRPSEALGGCELAKSAQGVLAACARTGLAGGQLVVGSFREDLDVEKTFAFGTSHRFSATGAVAVAASCAGGSEGGIDLFSATKVCVRDGEARWTELGIGLAAGRRGLVPRLDGGVLLVRDSPTGKVELVAIERGAAATVTPRVLELAEHTRDLVSVDEIAAGRFVAWFRTTTELRALVVEVRPTVLRMAEALPRAVLDGKAMVGTYADRAMVVSVVDVPVKHVEASITTDGGRTWSYDAWPASVDPLDATAVGKRVECGALGCRTLGWSRLGWHPKVAVHDTIVSLGSAPSLPPPPPSMPRSNEVIARCTTSASATVPIAQVPLAPTVYPLSPNDVLLGLPTAKLAANQAQVLTPIGRNVRGGFVSIGPTLGSWADTARTVLRFSTDLDPLGQVHETAPFALFADRNAAQNAVWSARPTAWATGPKRLVFSLCTYGRCELWRAAAAVVPEKVDLGVTAQAILGARELGSVLAVLGQGWPNEASGASAVTSATKTLDPQPFVALVGPQGVTVSFLARASWASESQLGMTYEPVRGAFGVLELTTAPAWTHGMGYVLPIGTDARPAGPFEQLVAATPDVARPTTACGLTTPGWDDGDAATGRTLTLLLDGTEARAIPTEAGVVRSRMSASDACLDRFTVWSRRASFQFDAHAGHGLLYELLPDGKNGKRSELTCTLSWK